MSSNVFDFYADEEQLEQIKHLINSPAWQGYFVAKLTEWQDAAIGLLLDPSEERKQKTPDDYLRAVVTVCERVKRLGPAEVFEQEHDGLGQSA